MSDGEFNRLINEMMTGLPVTVTLNRLVLVLRAVVFATGEGGAQALRGAVQAYRDLDRRDYFTGDSL